MTDDEIAGWIDANAPKSLYGTVSTPFQGYWGGRRGGFASDDERRWFDACLAQGWTAPTWPRRYGGGEMTSEQHRAWRTALQDRGLPLPLVGFGLTMIGPILLAHGDDADWIFALVRTSDDGPKQQGITFLVFPMDLPGITVRPIALISGASPFCEVFFDRVRVPVTSVVGRLGEGWRVAKALLEHERGMVGESVAAGGARPGELVGYTLRRHAEEVIGLDGHGRIADPLLEREIVRFERDEACVRLTVQRVNDRVSAGDAPGPEASILKIVGTELNQRRWDLALRIAGLDGLGWSADPYAPRDVAMARHWLRSRGNTIEGGTSEIQRNVVARHVLGLPKGQA
jgi:alkylation response protein AidB-like acyl-CoA dehydrogenase